MKATFFILLISFIFFSCTKENNPTPVTPTAKLLPTVTTAEVSSVTDTTVISGGNVSSDGGVNVTARGVCWSTSTNPLVSSNHTTDGAGTGTFSSAISGLNPGTTYYTRAYSTNSVGTAYGNEVSFTTPKPSAFKDIYMCGDVMLEAKANAAVYWKNDSIVFLSDGSNYATAEGISVEGNDVYVGGYELNIAGQYVAVYWKNGTKVILGDGVTASFVYDISVNNGNVYAAGVKYTQGGEIATLWVNGIPVSMATSSTHSVLRSVAAKGTDVYTGGRELILNPQVNAARVWKNNISMTTIPFAQYESEVQSIVIDENNDVYALSSEIVNFNTLETKIKLWKNWVNIPFNAGALSNAYNIKILNGDTYVAVTQKGGDNKFYAKYRKNNSEINLPDEGNSASAQDIGFRRSEIIVGGFLSVNGYPLATYWKDGKLVKLGSNYKSSLIKKIFSK